MLAMAAFTFWGALGVGRWALGATKLYVMEPVALGKGLAGAGVAAVGAGGPLGRMGAAGGVVLVATV